MGKAETHTFFYSNICFHKFHIFLFCTKYMPPYAHLAAQGRSQDFANTKFF